MLLQVRRRANPSLSDFPRPVHQQFDSNAGRYLSVSTRLADARTNGSGCAAHARVYFGLIERTPSRRRRKIDVALRKCDRTSAPDGFSIRCRECDDLVYNSVVVLRCRAPTASATALFAFFRCATASVYARVKRELGGFVTHPRFFKCRIHAGTANHESEAQSQGETAHSRTMARLAAPR